MRLGGISIFVFAAALSHCSGHEQSAQRQANAGKTADASLGKGEDSGSTPNDPESPSTPPSGSGAGGGPSHGGNPPGAESPASPNNKPPIFHEVETQKIQEGETLDFSVSAQDPEGTAISYTCQSCPEGLSLEAGSGRILWTPSATQTGNQKIEIKATDADEQWSAASVQVVVGEVDQAPKFTSVGPLQIAELDELKFELKAQDPEGKAVTYSCKTGCPKGMSTAADGKVVWTPQVDQSGDYLVGFSASDGIIETTMNVAIQVRDMPMFGALAFSLNDSKTAWRFTFAKDQRSKEQAAAEALKACASAECKVQYDYVNNCAAVASNAPNSAKRYSLTLVANLATRKLAEKSALDDCNNRATSLGESPCSVLGWSCSGVSDANQQP